MATGTRRVGGAATTAKQTIEAKAAAGTVAGTAAETSETPVAEGEKTRKSRPVFVLDTAVGTVDGTIGMSVYNSETKKLNGVPTNFKHGEFKPLGNADFDNGADYMEFRASTFQYKLDNIAEKIKSWEENVEECRNSAKRLRLYKDDDTRKKALKRDKLAAQLKQLEAELATAETNVEAG